MINAKTLLRRGTALMIGGSLLFGGFFTNFPGSSMQAFAATYNRVGEGTYQLLDGTAITGILARGIDVSHWQGEIDWKQVAQDDISFTMLGTRYKGAVDPLFHKNATEASAAGIKLGAYIYSYAMTPEEAEAEADFILDLIKDYPISYPVAFDVEDRTQGTLSPQQISAIINAFCKKIEAAGYHPMVYANDYWLANKIDLSQIDYDIWVARYEVKHNFENPVMWQATSTGTVKGVTGGVDIDFQYKDFSNDVKANLWRTIGDKTYYYKDYTMQRNTWIDDGTGWFYMNHDAQAATGWLNENGKQYYLDPVHGRMVTGWLNTDTGWHYFDNSGVMTTGWIHDGTNFYHMNAEGVMETGWIQDQNSWYFLNNSGAMVTGKQNINENWYFFDASGAMMTGWQQLDGNWYFFHDSGMMQTGWLDHNGSRYYLDPSSGMMAVGPEITVDGVTYQVLDSGACQPVQEPTAEENSPAETPSVESPTAETTTILPFGS